MGNTPFQKIQKTYGQKGVEYIAFRYNQRKSYSTIKKLREKIKQQAMSDQRIALQSVNTQKRKLQQEYNNAKKEAQSEDPGNIERAESMSKQKIQVLSGYSQQVKKLDDIYHQINKQYETRKEKAQKNMRQDVMKIQNKSSLVSIKQFDVLSDWERKSIQKQCIKKYPEKVSQLFLAQIQTKLNWNGYKHYFDNIFDQKKMKKQAQEGRKRVRNNILPSRNTICC